MPPPIQLDDEFQARLDAGLWWKLFRRALKFKRQLIPLFFASVGIAICDASYAQITRWVIDGVVRDGANAPFAKYIAVYALVTFLLCAGVFGFIELAGRLAHLL
ncbi:MAG: transporter related, partial [Verrucomicrobia bacterium]|nr:transporter related [Verrucomicrobiota bacterium]